jgi:hypothetical protein
MYIGVWWENLKEMIQLEDLGIDVTVLQLILNRVGEYGLDSYDLG